MLQLRNVVIRKVGAQVMESTVQQTSVNSSKRQIANIYTQANRNPEKEIRNNYVNCKALIFYL